MRVLQSVAKELPNWTVMVRKMKAIYHTMNLFNMDVSKKCLIGECWVPLCDLQIVQNCLTEGTVSLTASHHGKFTSAYEKCSFLAFMR